MSKANKPRRRKRGLATQRLAHEVLVYDLERHRAHRLNEVAARVWRQCDGETGVSQMARALKDELGLPADPELVRYALDRLGRAHLLEARTAPAKHSRRDFLNRLKKVGLAASVALPVVSSIVSPAPAHAASCVPVGDCSAVPDCTPCHNGNPGQHCGKKMCCGGNCVNNTSAQNNCGC